MGSCVAGLWGQPCQRHPAARPATSRAFKLGRAGDGLQVTSGGEQLTSQGKAVPPTHWGISNKQLKDFLAICRSHPSWKEGMTAREVDEEIIRDLYKDGRSVALSFNDSAPLEVNVLISHCWDEDLAEFLNEVLGRLEDSDAAFICLLSQYQGSMGQSGDIDAQVKQGSKDINEGVFAKVLNHVSCLPNGRISVIPCHAVLTTGGIYGRLWCTWEIYNSIVLKEQQGRDNFTIEFNCPLHVRTSYYHHGYFFGERGLEGFRSKNGRCGPPWQKHKSDDEIMIREAIDANTEVSWEVIDKKIKQYMRKEFETIKKIQQVANIRELREKISLGSLGAVANRKMCARAQPEEWLHSLWDRSDSVARLGTCRRIGDRRIEKVANRRSANLPRRRHSQLSGSIQKVNTSKGG